MDIGLDKINNNADMNVDELFKKYTKGDERTVKIIVYDDPDDGQRPREVFEFNEKILWSQGLAHRNGKIVKISLPEYTVIYKMTISAWFKLISQENTFRDLIWSDKIDTTGQWFFRDIVVWDKFWNTYKDIIKLNFIEKLLLRRKGDS